MNQPYKFELHKKKFFRFSDELNEEMNLIEEKLHRDLLVSKLLRDDSIIIESGLEKNNFQKFITRSFLFFSKESRQLIVDSPSLNKQDVNFQALIGIDCNNFKDQSGKITKKEILGLCNKYITLTDCNILKFYTLKYFL